MRGNISIKIGKAVCVVLVFSVVLVFLSDQSYSLEIENNDRRAEEIASINVDQGFRMNDEKMLSRGGTPEYDQKLSQVMNLDLEKFLHSRFISFSDTIDVSKYNITESELWDIMYWMADYYADLFFLYGTDEVNVNYSGFVTTFKPYYMGTKEVNISKLQKFNAEVEKVKSLVKTWMSDLEVALVVHDFMNIHIAYDYDNYLNNTIPYESYYGYGTLVNRRAVCNGFTMAYLHLLRNVFDIPTEYVLGEVPAGKHSWNMVQIDGDYYHVDVTWDDYDRDMIGYSNHYYFLLSDQAMESRQHFNWESEFYATNTKYDNAFWTTIESPFARILDKYYYVDSNNYALKEWDVRMNTHKKIIELDDAWIEAESGGYYYGSFSKLMAVRGKLFFNKPDGIYSINIDGTNLKLEHKISTDQDGLPFAFAYRDGIFEYIQLRKLPLDSTPEIHMAEIRLGPAVKSMQIDASDLTLLIGQQRPTQSIIVPEDAMNPSVVWENSNPKVAVYSNGIITAKMKGQTTISAITLDGDYRDSIIVTVLDKEYVNKLSVIAGESRYTTAVEISKAQYTKSDTAILVLGNNFPDALAAGPLAKDLSAPILLTQKSRVSSSTLEELKRLGVKRVVLLGGEAVIGEEVEKILKNNDFTQNIITSVERISGNNRYETAVAAAVKLSGGDKVPKVILASGESFADALAVGSYASREGIPILLTKKGSLSGVTRTALNDLEVQEVIILGGEAAVSRLVEEEVKKSSKVTRVSGENRYATSVAISDKYFSFPKEAIIASGTDFADALAAAPLAASKNIPILLVGNRSVATTVAGYLDQGFTKLYVIGGTSAIGEVIREELLVLIN